MPERIAEPPARLGEGLCAACTRASRIVNDRGSVFVRCLYATHDPSFPKYPRLPVIACRAFVSRDSDSPA